jgi:predicted DNA-binding transcriptional regulator YafY
VGQIVHMRARSWRYARDVGRRGAHESIIDVFVAFMEQRSWTQAELARRVGVGAATIRKLLSRLKEGGLPLERDEEHPHVYWSIRKGWVPGGVALTGDEVRLALRLLARAPSSKSRERLIARLLALSPDLPPPLTNPTEQVAEDVLVAIEDAASRRLALRFDYLSGGRGTRGWRTASVHRIEYGATARFVATCHRARELRRFRVDRVLSASIDRNEPFHAIDPDALSAFVAASIDGFSGRGPAVPCAFVVVGDAARWAQSNLPSGALAIEPTDDGIRVTTKTAGIEVLARFVVGLGGAARVETEELRAEVMRLAHGSLAVATERAASTTYQVDTISAGDGVSLVRS